MRARLGLLALCCCFATPVLAAETPAAEAPIAATVVTAAPIPAAKADGNTDWWHSGYLVDYGIIALGGVVYLARKSIDPADKALIGPAWDANNPAATLDAAHSDRIGRNYVDEGKGETVSTGQVTVLVGLAGVYLAAQEGIPWAMGKSPNARTFHDLVVGYLESVALTAGFTESSKLLFGRLRPDFQSRARRHLCAKDASDATLCPDGKTTPLDPDPHEADEIFADGRKSFFSGHSSFSFNFATYTSLAIGGAFVWGDDATPTSRTAGLLSQTALMGTAFFIAASRIDDGRHHLSDVMTGAAVGVGLASFSYWRRFGSNGKVRPRPNPNATTVSLTPGPGAVGLSLRVRY